MADAPVMYPLDPVSVNGTLITLDTYVQSPTIVHRTIADLTMLRFFADRIFSNGPEITGGAILFERPNALTTDLFAGRDFEEIAPGTEIPRLTFQRGVPMVATPKELAGGFDMTKQDIKRNNPRLMENAMIQAGNTLRRKLELMALGELAAVTTSESRTTPAVSGGWATAAGKTLTTTAANNRPMADFAAAQTLIDLEERGHVLNGAIMNPADLENLRLIYEDRLDAALADQGITEYFSTPRIVAGTVQLYEAGAVGGWSNEFPLDLHAWVDDKRDQLRVWDWTISPAMFVDDQFAILQITGVNS